MKLRIAVASAAFLAFGASAIASDTGEMRVALMKKNGAAVGALAAMAKGQAPFDQATVKMSLETIAEVGKTFPEHFGPGTETASAEASPAIWENMDDFKARAAKLASDAEAQLVELPSDASGLGPVLGVLGPNCGGCHEKYRLKKN